MIVRIIAMLICLPIGMALIHGIDVGGKKLAASSAMSFLTDNFNTLSVNGVVTVGTLAAVRDLFPDNRPQIHFLMANMPQLGKPVDNDPKAAAAAAAIRADRRALMPGVTPLYTYEHGRTYGISHAELGESFHVDWKGNVRVI